MEDRSNHSSLSSTSEAWTFHGDHQEIMSAERPETWFLNSHRVENEDSFEATPVHRNSKKAVLQSEPRPWISPPIYQEIVESPARWLGGCDPSSASPPTSPRRAPRRCLRKAVRGELDLTAHRISSRGHPEPIDIKGLTFHVKDSPFLRQGLSEE